MGTSEHPPASQSQGESYLTSLLHPLLHPHSLFSIFSGSRTDNIAWPKPSSCGTLWRSDSDYSHCSVCLLMLTPLCIHPPLLRKKNHRIYPLLSEFSKYRHSRVRLPDFPLAVFTRPHVSRVSPFSSDLRDFHLHFLGCPRASESRNTLLMRRPARGENSYDAPQKVFT